MHGKWIGDDGFNRARSLDSDRTCATAWPLWRHARPLPGARHAIGLIAASADGIEQITEGREQCVFFLPRRVHETSNVRHGAGGVKPAFYGIQVISIVVTG